MAASKSKVTRITPSQTRDEYAMHPVTITLSKAQALAWLLDELGEPHGDGPPNNLQHALEFAPAETHAWLHGTIAAELRATLAEAEVEFRKSLTPEQAQQQVVGEPAPAAK